MGASVRIEDEAFSDERYEDLALFAGLPDADCARGKMARLWRQCTLEHTHKIETHVALRVLGPNGVEALIRARLGERVGDSHVRIRGTKGRIEWLKQLRENGKHGVKGGRPKRNTDNPPGLGKQNPSGVPQGSAIETPPAPAPAPTGEERGDSPRLAALKSRVDSAMGDIGRQRAKRPAKAHPDQQAAIDAFHGLFKATYGTKPTWGAAEIGMLGMLLKKQPLHEILTRARFMFDGKAKWPPGPYSLDVLVKNFDKFVEQAQPELRISREL